MRQVSARVAAGEAFPRQHAGRPLDGPAGLHDAQPAVRLELRLATSVDPPTQQPSATSSRRSGVNRTPLDTARTLWLCSFLPLGSCTSVTLESWLPAGWIWTARNLPD